jgi:Family of unknown function (DUF5330)
MFFLLRIAFWLSIVVLLLPIGFTQPTPLAPQPGAMEALSAASAAFSDMRQFCSRQPEACTVGSQAASAFGQKAQASAKMVYEYLTDRAGDGGKSAAVQKTAASTSEDKTSQNTLTEDDRMPAWRGAQPRLETIAKKSG